MINKVKILSLLIISISIGSINISYGELGATNGTSMMPKSTVNPNETVMPNIEIGTSPVPTVIGNVAPTSVTPVTNTAIIADNITPTTVPMTIETPSVGSQGSLPIESPTPPVSSIPATNKGFLEDFYDKILFAVVVGFISLSYEIIKIRYEHKKKNESEKLKEDKKA